MSSNLENLNLSLISTNSLSVFSIKTPKSIFDGSYSAIMNVFTAIGLGGSFMVMSPYIQYKKSGVLGIINGTLKGSIVGSIVLVIGSLVGIFQLVRGIFNTPNSIYQLLKGKSWSELDNKWIYYNLEQEMNYVKQLEKEYHTEINKPIDMTYYDILEIDYKNISLKDIKKQYYKKALLIHPDKNLNNENAEKEFQLLSNAYHTLSNPDEKINYDKYGIDNNKKQTLLESKYIFELLFGNEIFKNLIGDFYIYLLITAPDEKTLHYKQRKRILDITLFLENLIQPYINGDMELYQQSIKALLEEFNNTVIGNELVGIIGYTYKQQLKLLNLNIYHSGKKILNDLHQNFNIVSSFMELIYKVYDNKNYTKSNYEIDPLDTEEYDFIDMEKEERIDIFYNIIDLIWHLTLIDIEHTLKHVCRNLILDGKYKQKIVTQAISKFADILIDYSNRTNHDNKGLFFLKQQIYKDVSKL